MLKYVILGILKEKPSTGYEIRKIIDSRLQGIWSATHAQIYPELNQMFTAGLITYEIDVKGKHLERKRYSITERGDHEFQRWLETDSKSQLQIKDELRLKVFFGNNLDGEIARTQLEAQIDQHKKVLEELNEQSEYWQQSAQEDQSAIYDELVIKGKILQEKSYIEWLHLCIETMEQFN